MARIYISSTYKDLVDARNTAMHAVLSVNHMPRGMEQYTASDQRPLDYCLKDVAACQGYIGIIARRYGYVPSGHGQSITHLEYLKAQELGIPRLICLLDPAARWPVEFEERDSRLDDFRKDLATEKMCLMFSDHDQLGGKLLQALQETFGMGRPIPRFLPHLCDRDKQKSEVEDCITVLRRHPAPRPAALLIHGDEQQAQDIFFEQLCRDLLPRFLDFGDQSPPVKSYHPEWPGDETDPGALQARFRRNLAEKVVGRRSAEATEIDAAMAAQVGPVVVCTSLHTEEFGRQGEAAIRTFIEFWAQWPALPGGRLLFPMMFIKYLGGEELSWFKRWRYGRLNARCEAMLRKFERGNGGVQVKVLSKLPCITKGDVLKWAGKDETKEFCRAVIPDGEISEIFLRWAKRRRSDEIPMEPLAQELERLLYRYNGTEDTIR